MSLARFFPRIHDAIGPLLTSSADLQEFLARKLITLQAPLSVEDDPVHLAGFALATNLCARLYPRLVLLGPRRVVEQCASIAQRINPLCAIDDEDRPSDGRLAWASPHVDKSTVTVAPTGWDVAIDDEQARSMRPSNIPVSLAAACVGVGELFRQVFAPFLPNGRVTPKAGILNLLTLERASGGLPPLPSRVQIGRVHLAGAGAIGQAVAYTLARVGVEGLLVVTDPERIELSNLQRYVLAEDIDVGTSKCSAIVRAFQGSSLEVMGSETRWGDDALSVDGVDTVCTALDSSAARVAVQSGLPRRIYNAWTQPRDIGWSRHERFGTDPCLACLYWPDRPRPSDHELISIAIGQHQLRVLAYLTLRIPVDVPLRPEQVPKLPLLPAPADSPSWSQRSILVDIASARGLPDQEVARWQGKPLSDLYREGVCGGALLARQTAKIPGEMAVPLAHQSALAGVMLATQLLVGSSPELASFRASATEGRLDLLAGLPKFVSRPRQLKQACICSDSDFLTRFRSKWPGVPPA